MLLKSVTFVLLAVSFAFPQSVTIPDTPSGHTLRAWLEAFNSADPARIQAYVSKYEPMQQANQMMEFRQQTGGFQLLSIDKSDRLHIDFRVKEEASPTNAVGSLEVKDADPAVVVSFSLRAIPAGGTATYADVAERIGAPRAVRAVAQACAANPLAVAIPCHRVVRQDGALSGYRWGVARKRLLLEREAAS